MILVASGYGFPFQYVLYSNFVFTLDIYVSMCVKVFVRLEPLRVDLLEKVTASRLIFVYFIRFCQVSDIKTLLTWI